MKFQFVFLTLFFQFLKSLSSHPLKDSIFHPGPIDFNRRSTKFIQNKTNNNVTNRSNLRRLSNQRVEKLEVELLVVVDYSIYKRWLKLSKNDEEETIKNLVQYYSYISASVDQIFRQISISKFKFSVKIITIYICKNKEDSFFSESPYYKAGRNKLIYKLSLQSSRDWLEKKDLTHVDAAAFFTAYEAQDTSAGLSYVGSACKKNKVFLVRDMGIYGTSEGAAHELGHCLGASHDGVLNKCEPKEKYIMSSIHDPAFDPNRQLFSVCSVEYFESFVDKLKKINNNCLNKKNVQEHLNLQVRNPSALGLKYSVEEQCKHIYGNKSFFCSRGLDSDSNICHEMFCFDSNRDACVMTSGSRGLDGTNCGFKKWCQNGKCVPNSNPPEKITKCIYGDFFGFINADNESVSCDHFRKNRIYCYDKKISSKCCRTCQKIESEDPSCPYGDRFLNCYKVIKRCEEPKIRRACCGTCKENLL